MGPNPCRMVRCRHVWKLDPLGACVLGSASGARTSLPLGEEVWCRHVPLRNRLLS
jgi:hypothetical protein